MEREVERETGGDITPGREWNIVKGVKDRNCQKTNKGNGPMRGFIYIGIKLKEG
jgi:hypothetical protein